MERIALRVIERVIDRDVDYDALHRNLLLTPTYGG